MLFGEPTPALDPELVSDQVVFMDDGVVVEAGTPAEVLGSPRRERTRAFLSKVF